MIQGFGKETEGSSDVTQPSVIAWGAMKEWYDKAGTRYEFYGTESERCPAQLKRKGEPIEPYNMQVRYQSIRDYGWSATLLCDWLAEQYK